MEVNEQFVKLLGELSKENYYRVYNYACKLRNQQGDGSEQESRGGVTDDYQYPYLSILSPEAKAFVIQVDKENGLNLYHSAAAYISNRIQLESDEILESYYNKYAPKRKYVSDNKELIREIITKVHNKVAKKRR
ncbi:MAG: hypothetical protein KJ774_08245 [Firmicutes bacterium]|nr:hypothetical protein [Bacillota bacterium]